MMTTFKAGYGRAQPSLRTLAPALLLALAPLLGSQTAVADADGTCSSTGGQVQCTFNYTGAAQTWIAPSGLTQVTLDVFGAQGGASSTTNNDGGPGGEDTATLHVLGGDSLQIMVGGAGGAGAAGGVNGGAAPTGGANGGAAGPSVLAGGAGGFNGGGSGGAATVLGSGLPVFSGGGGGGASDVRGGACANTTSCGLDARVLVAGGGGGTAINVAHGATAGVGGGVMGGSGVTPTGANGAAGGSSTTGGSGGSGSNLTAGGGNGGQGIGGNGGVQTGAPIGGGGGGGGWFGGGGGYIGQTGGGGSGHGPMLQTTEHAGVRSGNGQVILTYTATVTPNSIAPAQPPFPTPAPAPAPTAAPVPVSTGMTAPLYRLFDTIYGDHLYTTSTTERDQAIANDGYSSEGIGAYVSTTGQAGLVPLYRVSRTSSTPWDRLYTTSATERDQAVANDGYVSEGIAAYVSTTPQTGLVPLYRLYNAGAGQHLFTTSTTERDVLSSQGWVNETINAYVTSPVGPTPTPLPTTSATVTLSPLPTTSPTVTLAPPIVLATATPTPLATTSATATSAPTSPAATATPKPTATPTTGLQLLVNPGFESGTATPWVITSSGANYTPGLVISPNGATESAHSGSWYALLDGWGMIHTDTLAQTVTIPAATTTATLSFWLHIDTAEGPTTIQRDTLTLQILDANGAALATLHTWSNLNHNVGYTQQSFDVTAYKGQAITIKFTGTEDLDLQTSFVIDDTALTTQ